MNHHACIAARPSRCHPDRLGRFPRRLPSLFVLATSLAWAAFAAPDLGAAGTYLVNENFNAMSVGSTPGSPWSVVNTGGSVTVQGYPFAADHSVKLNKTASSGATTLAQTVSSTSGRIAFEAKVLAAETAGFKAIPYIYNSSGTTVASVSFQDGTIYANIGGTKTSIQSFNANEWYLVRIVVDTGADTFDLFIDGVRKEHGVALRSATSSVNQFSYYMDGTNTGTLYVDNVRVYQEAAYIGGAPSPVYDVRNYGAVGDGSTMNTTAIQNAINACAGTGGSVYLAGGTYLSGTLNLKSNMTFFIDSSATLLGSPNATDYPTQSPATGNTQLHNCQRALLYANAVSGLKIDGGGSIDGQGDSFSGSESTRPISIWTVLSNNITIQNLYLKKGAVWSIVNMESDTVTVQNINLQSNSITHDGIDTVDGTGITIQNCAVQSGDDGICLKSGVRRGINQMTVQNCFVTPGSNGLKFGTASYGAFANVTLQDCYVKHAPYAAMAVESKEGADVNGIYFKRVQFDACGIGHFVFLGQQATTHPIGDVPKLGSMTNVQFTDTFGDCTATWGTLVTGHLYNGTTYYITNLTFTNCDVIFKGGLTSVPGTPPEWNSTQYVEANMFGNLPAWGYYLRHVQTVTFSGCTSSVTPSDVRHKLVTSDVSGLTGSP